MPAVFIHCQCFYWLDTLLFLYTYENNIHLYGTPNATKSFGVGTALVSANQAVPEIELQFELEIELQIVHEIELQIVHEIVQEIELVIDVRTRAYMTTPIVIHVVIGSCYIVL